MNLFDRLEIIINYNRCLVAFGSLNKKKEQFNH